MILKKVGADEVIILEIDEGRRLANRLVSPYILERIPISGNQTLAEIRVNKSFDDKSLLKLDLRNKYGVNVVSIKRMIIDIDNKSEQIIQPQPSEIIKDGDILVVIGKDEDIDFVREFK